MYGSKPFNQTPPSMGRRVKTDPGNGTSRRKRNWSASVKGFRPASLLPVILILVLLGGAGVAAWYFQSETMIQSVRVNGNYFTETDDILRIAAIPLMVSPDSISFLATLYRVETLPYIDRAALRMASRGELQLTVTEREPIGLFIHGSRRVYADADGVILPVRAGCAVDVPLVYGVPVSARQDTLRSAAFMEIRDFLVEARKIPLAAATLSEIAWTSEQGIVALSHENGIRLVFGRDRYAEALKNWDLFYRQVVAVRGPQQFTSVDLRYNGQIVTRES